MAESRQFTIRNVSASLAQRLKALAEVEGTSVNALVLKLLDQAVGIDERRRRLEDRYGTWSEEDFQEFQEALAVQRTVDEHLWQ